MFCFVALALVRLLGYRIFGKNLEFRKKFLTFAFCSGPNGVWTLEKQGKQIDESKLSSFDKCIPTFSHRAIVALIRAGYVKFVVSQNIDGLFLKANTPRPNIAELHGNYFLDECSTCWKRFIRNTPSSTMACKETGEICRRKHPRPCRGLLTDTILDWEQSLPEIELIAAEKQATKSDLSICLGTTLQINPAGLLPLRVLRRKRAKQQTKLNKKIKQEVAETEDIKSEHFKVEECDVKKIDHQTINTNGIKRELEEDCEDCKSEEPLNKLVIVNLQPTKYDPRAQLVVHQYIDRVMAMLCQQLNLTVPDYDPKNDPTKIYEHLTEWK